MAACVPDQALRSLQAGYAEGVQVKVNVRLDGEKGVSEVQHFTDIQKVRQHHTVEGSHRHIQPLLNVCRYHCAGSCMLVRHT